MNQNLLHERITCRLLHFINSREERLAYGVVRKGAFYGISMKLIGLSKYRVIEKDGQDLKPL